MFEGEINISEQARAKKSLRIKKMYNQRYVESELPLIKERLMAQEKKKSEAHNVTSVN